MRITLNMRAGRGDLAVVDATAAAVTVVCSCDRDAVDHDDLGGVYRREHLEHPTTFAERAALAAFAAADVAAMQIE